LIDTHTVLLAAHVASGAASLVTGALARWLPAGRRRAVDA
jgi:hypothetical protein